MTTFALPTEYEGAFQTLASKTGRSMDDLMREAMARFLEEMEDREDEQEARKILEEYRRNPGKSFTLDDALDHYGLKRGDLTS